MHTCQPLLGVNLSPELLKLYFPYQGQGPGATKAPVGCRGKALLGGSGGDFGALSF